ncbi:MAG: YfiR family protein [Bacteroidetes bacterium]|nr:YfiR family protein [Bacteroidota bacterium]
MKRFIKKIYFICLAFILIYGTAVKAQPPTAMEKQVKAVFLFNFTQFTEWPANAFSSPEAPLVIGILGDDPFGKYIDEVIAGEKANNHPLVVKRYSSEEDIKNCHVLFINISESNKQKQVLSGLKNEGILTISDQSTFLKQGGMIRFFTKDNKIQFQINPDAVKSDNLIISSKLLRLASIYKSDKK